MNDTVYIDSIWSLLALSTLFAFGTAALTAALGFGVWKVTVWWRSRVPVNSAKPLGRPTASQRLDWQLHPRRSELPYGMRVADPFASRNRKELSASLAGAEASGINTTSPVGVGGAVAKSTKTKRKAAPKLPKRDELRIALWTAYYHGATPEQYRELVYEAVEELNEAERVETRLQIQLSEITRTRPTPEPDSRP